VCICVGCAYVRSLGFCRGVILSGRGREREPLVKSAVCAGRRDKDSMMCQCCIVRRQCHSSPKHSLAPSRPKWSKMSVTEQYVSCKDFLSFVCERKRLCRVGKLPQCDQVYFTAFSSILIYL